MAQFYEDCPFCHQLYTWQNGEPIAECPCYEKLLIDLAIYQLPDGTEAQAIWTGHEPAEGVPDHWILAPADNTETYHQQYEIRRSGAIVRVYQSQAGATDLTLDDLALLSNPWES